MIDPMQNELPDCEIEKLQFQLQLQLQAEQMNYREAMKHDKVLEEVKPIRLKIRFLQEKITAIKISSTLSKLNNNK